MSDMRSPVLLEDLPFQHAAGIIWLELRLDAQAARFDGREGDAVEGVELHAVIARALDRFPLFADAIEQAPGLRGAATAFAGVVEPIDFDAGNFARLDELVFEPLGGAAMIPPGEARDGGIVGCPGHFAIDDRIDGIVLEAVGGGDRRGGGDGPLVSIAALAN